MGIPGYQELIKNLVIARILNVKVHIGIRNVKLKLFNAVFCEKDMVKEMEDGYRKVNCPVCTKRFMIAASRTKVTCPHCHKSVNVKQ